MMTEAAYNALIAELDAIANKFGVELTDANVDAENAIDAGHEYGTANFWRAAMDSACMAAGDRAESAGLNLNKAASRIIY